MIVQESISLPFFTVKSLCSPFYMYNRVVIGKEIVRENQNAQKSEEESSEFYFESDTIVYYQGCALEELGGPDGQLLHSDN